MGYGIIETGATAGQTAYLECGVIAVPQKAPLENRLGTISLQLQEIVQEFRPGAVAVEQVFHAVNVRSALTLGHARGVALAVAGVAGVPVHAYAPTLIKKCVTGFGRAGKEQVADMVRMLLYLKRSPRSDAADALAVALTHARFAKIPQAPSVPRGRSKVKRS